MFFWPLVFGPPKFLLVPNQFFWPLDLFFEPTCFFDAWSCGLDPLMVAFPWLTDRTLCLLHPLSTNQRMSCTVWESHMLEGCTVTRVIARVFSSLSSDKEWFSLAASGFCMCCIVLQSCISFPVMQTTGFFRGIALKAHTAGWFLRGLARSKVGTDESRGQVTSLGLDVTWSCRSHRILGLRVQRTSCAVWESGFWGSIVRLCHCICTYYYIYFLSHFFHSFHSLVPFQPYLAALGPVEYLGLFCTASNCDDCFPPRFSFPLLSSLTCKDQDELDKLW